MKDALQLKMVEILTAIQSAVDYMVQRARTRN